MSAEWWQVARGATLEQGQVVAQLLNPRYLAKQFFAMTEPNLQFNVKCERFTGITITQSCDLLNDEIKRVVLCKIIGVVEGRERYGFGDVTLEEIRKGRRPSWVLLAPAGSDNPEDAFLVDFRYTVSLPKDYVSAVAEKMGDRPALLSPYLEYFSAAFGRCFSRVALPNEAPLFGKPSSGDDVAA